ncbi:hypothetical protein AKJ16_DCAP19017 [Drosera capensis]
MISHYCIGKKDCNISVEDSTPGQKLLLEYFHEKSYQTDWDQTYLYGNAVWPSDEKLRKET